MAWFYICIYYKRIMQIVTYSYLKGKDEVYTMKICITFLMMDCSRMGPLNHGTKYILHISANFLNSVKHKFICIRCEK